VAGAIGAAASAEVLAADRTVADPRALIGLRGGVRVAVGAGISVIRPSGWHVLTAPLTRVRVPAQRLVVTSFVLHQSHLDGGCSPSTAIGEVPPTGAFLFMWEYRPLPRGARSGPPRRPMRFVAGRNSYGSYSRTVLTTTILFRDAGRWFQAELYLGTPAGHRTAATLLSVLDSLVVRPLPALGRSSATPILER
jgi:hypothetical protein